MQDDGIIKWQAPDHELPERQTDWYLSVFVVGLSAVIAAIFLDNFLFAIFCFIATISIIINAVKKPEMLDFSISNRGIQVRHDFFPYRELHSFWMEHDNNRNDIILHTNRNVLPHMIVPVRGISPEYVRNELRKHLPEKYAHKNLLDRALEYLGF